MTTTTTRQDVKLSKGVMPGTYWLESVKDDSIFTTVERRGSWDTLNYAHVLYFDQIGGAIYEVVYDKNKTAVKWITRTFREVK